MPESKIICGDNVDVMSNMKDNSIDMILTSPPYDNLRDYKGYSFNLHKVGVESYRVLKDGGVFVMVVQDQTKNFGKTLTSFRTIVDYCDEIGFKLFETVIYKKQGVEGAWWTKRFRVDHEYIPIFLKGDRPLFFDKEHLKIPSKHGGKTLTGAAVRRKDGSLEKSRKIKINKLKCRGTIFNYTTCGDGSKLKHTHPATFPDQLPIDFIRCFCPEGGTVLDPFVGSGTTLIAAVNNDRDCLGIDISKEYCELSEKRLKLEYQKMNDFF
jgi:site-specific DNA-methyltransferase (adenine-specific)